MAREPEPTETEALLRSGGLLKFAAENAKDLPPSIVATICAAWDAVQTKAWDQKTATDSWLAYHSLCSLIKPATVDTVSTNLREIPPPRLKLWFKLGEPASLSRRSATRYLFLLMSLLSIAVILGFLASTANSLSSESRKLIDSGNQLTEKVVSGLDLLEPIIGSKPFSDAADQQKAIAMLQGQLQDLNYLQDQMLQKTQVMSRLISLGFDTAGYEAGTLAPVLDVKSARESVRGYYDNRRYVASYLLKEGINSGVIGSSVLPIVLGTMGACAYVIRLFQIKLKTQHFPPRPQFDTWCGLRWEL